MPVTIWTKLKIVAIVLLIGGILSLIFPENDGYCYYSAAATNYY